MPEPMDVNCPSCNQRLAAADESGLVNVLQEDLYEEHALEMPRTPWECRAIGYARTSPPS